MKRDLYNRIAASAPVNASAARAVSMRGEHEPAINIPEQMAHWDAPPKTYPAPVNATERRGRKFGRLTVVGWLRRKKDRGSQWLVRCVCGQYEVRYSKAIDNPDNTEDSCQRCHKLAYHRSERYQHPEKFGADQHAQHRASDVSEPVTPKGERV